MSRPAIFPPKLSFHRSSGQARARWRGKDYYLGKWNSPESRAAYAKLIAVLASGAEPEPRRTAAPLTVANVVLAWETEEAPRYGDGETRRQFRFALRSLLGQYGATEAAAFDAAALHELRMRMTTEGVGRGGEQGLCRNTINRRVNHVRTVWRWVELKGLVPRGSWANLRAVPGLRRNDHRVRQTPKREGATWADVLAAARELAAAPRAMVLLQWWSGCRAGEACIMRPADVVRIGDDWFYCPAHHKCEHLGTVRAVPLGRKCMALLGPWLRATGPDDYLFTTKNGKRYCPNDYGSLIRAACERTGVKWTSHALRHSYRERVSRVLSLEHARAAMGHKSVAMTAQYGNPVDLKMAAEVARKLG